MPASAMKAKSGTRRVLYVALLGDVAATLAKFLVAAMTGSSAMLTEGIHSLVDTGNELLLLFGVRRGQRAVDEWHAFGYGKATYVWSLVVALSVFSIGGGVSVYEGILSLLHTPTLTDPTWNYVVLAIAAAFQGWSWRVSQQELERHRRPGESLWHSSQRNMDVLVYTVFVEDSAALVGIALAAAGIWLSHALRKPWLDPAASVAIGLVLIASAALLAHKSVSLLLGASLDREQIAVLRRIITADPAVERLGRLLTMRLGPDNVLLTAAVRFHRQLSLDQVEQAIDRLEHAIKVPYPSIQHLYLESGALKQAARSAVTEATANASPSAVVIPANPA
jgi:cation diffusion facilitator family transporter